MARKLCCICKAPLQNTYGNRRTCESPACRTEQAKRLSAKYSKKSKAERNKSGSQREISKIELYARELGLSYGQYVSNWLKT